MTTMLVLMMMGMRMDDGEKHDDDDDDDSLTLHVATCFSNVNRLIYEGMANTAWVSAASSSAAQSPVITEGGPDVNRFMFLQVAMKDQDRPSGADLTDLDSEDDGKICQDDKRDCDQDDDDDDDDGDGGDDDDGVGDGDDGDDGLSSVPRDVGYMKG